MIQKGGFKTRRLVLGIASALSFSISSGLCAENADVITLDIESQKAGPALLELAKNANVQIMVPNAIGETIQIRKIQGEYTLLDALNIMLDGTGLTYEFRSDESVVIKPDSSSTRNAGDKTDDKLDVDEEIVVTGSTLISDPHKLTRQVTTFSRDDIERSGITRLDDFLRRLPQNVNAPNNVGSGIDNPFNDSPPFGLGGNAFAGSSVNLRGLGAKYTLVLINGRRAPKGGQFGGISDISNIPLERVERIEVLFDGAAAIYGADAVGGVINVITNRTYEGTQVSLTAGGTTEGGGERYNFNLGHTFNWDSGSLTTTFSYQTQAEIDSADREIRLADPQTFELPVSNPGHVGLSRSRPIYFARDINGDGDTLDEELNERLPAGIPVDVIDFFGNPATTYVDRRDPAGGLGFGDMPVNPLPTPFDATGYTLIDQTQLPEYSGQPLSLYDLNGTTELGEDSFQPLEGLALAPKDETFSVGFAIDQELTESLNLSVSVDYSKTDKVSSAGSNATQFSLSADSASNPFGRSIDYVVKMSFPQEQQVVDQTAVSLTADLDWALSDNWDANFSFTLGKNSNQSDRLNLINTRDSQPGEEFRPTIRDYVNGYAIQFDQNFNRTRVELGTNFNDPLLGFASEAEFADALIIPRLATINDTENTEIEARVQGSLFTLPAGDVRTNISLSHRKNDFDVFNNTGLQFNRFAVRDVLDTGFVQNYDESYDASVNAVGTEVVLPVVGGEHSLPLVQNLLVNFNARYEDYSNVEDKGFNWTAGFNWELTDWMTVRFNRTFSQIVPEAARSALPERLVFNAFFRVLQDPSDPFSGRPPLPTEPQRQFLVLGGADDLVPERNYGSSLGFIFTPEFVEGLTLEVNLTESNTVDQIGTTGISTITAGLLQPDVIANIPTLRLAEGADIGREGSVFGSDVGVAVAPGDLISDARVGNVGSNRNQGADFELSYNTSSDFGDWFVSWRHQYVRSNEVLRNGVCGDLGADCQSAVSSVSGDGQVHDIVGSLVTEEVGVGIVPLPKHRGLLELNWGYRGLSVNVSGQYQEKTSITRRIEETGFFGEPVPDAGIIEYTDTTRPQQSANITLSYDFNGDLFNVPEWLSTTRVSLTVNDAWQKDQTITREFTRQEFESPLGDAPPLVNAAGLFPQGRAYSLNVRASF